MKRRIKGRSEYIERRKEHCYGSLACNLAVVLLNIRNLHFLEERYHIQGPYKANSQMLVHKFTQS